MFDVADNLAAIPGLVHGFTDRRGGVSEGRYATFNMASKWGDDVAAVARNRELLADHAGFDRGALRLARQVHGVAVIDAATASEGVEADGLWCRRSHGLVLGVLTADCVPVLLADREGRVVAAVHSGWRGTAGNIVGVAVAQLVAAGIPADALEAAIGPCIEQAAFEVGPEVASQFDAAYVDRRGARPHVDLVAVVRSQLQGAGVSAAATARVGGCTHAQPDRYYSYRRDGAGIGQMLAFIGWRAGA